MFDDTIRTDNQAALKELLEFLKVLDLKIIKPPKAANGKWAGTVKVELPIESAAPQFSEEKERIIVKWGGMDMDILDVKTGFGCGKGMFEMAPDFD